MNPKRWCTGMPSEEANHLNPAYCGALIYEFVRAYQNAKEAPAPFALLFCALPIALHRDTRNRLPKTTITRLLPWLEENRDVRVGYGDRARRLTPHVREALRYAATNHAVRFCTPGAVATGPKRASFTPTVLRDTTTDVRDTVNAIRMVARWFAASGNTATILAAWGVRV